MLDVTLTAAAFAGLLSFLSPCILPIVPFYLSYMAGQQVNAMVGGAQDLSARSGRAVLPAIMFAAGIITIFVGLGAAASIFGQ